METHSDLLLPSNKQHKHKTPLIWRRSTCLIISTLLSLSGLSHIATAVGTTCCPRPSSDLGFTPHSVSIKIQALATRLILSFWHSLHLPMIISKTYQVVRSIRFTPRTGSKHTAFGDVSDGWHRVLLWESVRSIAAKSSRI